jgi:uncharacterized sulfatase
MMTALKTVFSIFVLMAWSSLNSADFQYEILKAGETKPEGWIKQQMRLDLESGLTGNYHKVSNAVNLKVFENQNRPAGGKVEIPGEERLQKSWWSGEHEGYWKDSVVRMAFLLDNEEQKQRVTKWMNSLLEAQGEDGYIGIYSPDTRFPVIGENGELWTQSRIFQAMLAYYEFTGDKRILNAVERAVQLSLSKYMKGTYFGVSDPDGGVSHGVGYMDTLEWLFRLTSKSIYREGAVWLYEDYQNLDGRDEEMKIERLLNLDLPWSEHTPHIMEGLHMPAILHALTGEDKYADAHENALKKFDRHCNPGGGVVGDESVRMRNGSADMPSEYCTFTEGVSSLNRILAWQGELTAGDRVERVSLNAAQGARFQPVNEAVRYLTNDNQERADDHGHNRRFLYSAWHDAAACCTLNAGRLLPYYIEGMWFKKADDDLLLANLYGPCRVRTDIAGVKVEIVEKTKYPFSDKIVFKINPTSPARFTLSLRLPPCSENPIVKAEGASIDYKADRINITKTWKPGDEVQVDFNFTVNRIRDRNNEYFYKWGPLVFSLPLGENRKAVREFDALGGSPSGFKMWEIVPTDQDGWSYLLDEKSDFSVVKLPEGDPEIPWAHPTVGLKGTLLNLDKESVEVTLQPLGSTLLRRTSFAKAFDIGDYKRPNILFVISDDQSWPHASAYGSRFVNTPSFDRVARDGVLFYNAFSPSPQCSPCRASVLTGRNPWQNGPAAVHGANLPENIPTYTQVLTEAGYHVGMMGKGWAPGIVNGDNPAGKRYGRGINIGSFTTFLREREPNAPFCFWYGAPQPHRNYKVGSGLEAGKTLDSIDLPDYLPDTTSVRSDFLDYAVEIEQFDTILGQMLDLLETEGELDNTLVVVTSDNGMPWPRAKANLYEHGVHMPLAISWKNGFSGNRHLYDIVSLIDLAPTFLEVAGVNSPEGMTGKSLWELLRSGKSGYVDESRSYAVFGKERHTPYVRENDVGYPSRGIRTKRFLYIRNFKPERWPEGDVFYCGGPSSVRTLFLEKSEDPEIQEYIRLAWAKRPTEELYNIQNDPECMYNLIDEEAYQKTVGILRNRLTQILKEQNDPRILGNDYYDDIDYFKDDWEERRSDYLKEVEKLHEDMDKADWKHGQIIPIEKMK